MKTKYFLLGSLLTLGMVLVMLVTSLALAQEPDPGSPARALAPDAPDASSTYIPVQGYLTNASGAPLNGNYELTFRLYSSSSSVDPLCSYIRNVTATDGYFSAYFSGSGCSIDGRQLYLGIQVEDDPEMTPRQYISNVPYAWSLRPGAVVSGTIGSVPILHLETWSASGRALRAYAMDETGTNYGVVGASRSPSGYGGYFYNNGGGVGLRAQGQDTSPDIILAGNADTTLGDDGVLASDPNYVSSDIVIQSNDTVRIDLDDDGNGEDADFEIHDKDGNMIFDVDESGAVTYGGPGLATFPRPAYDSGWVSVTAGGYVTLNHNLGGNVDNYVVDLAFKHPSYGVHIFGLGADVTEGGFYGAYWRNLTTSSIRVDRATDDGECPQVRVRIWLYP